MTIAIIGTGFVGVVSAAVFTSHGHTVWGVDIDEAKARLLNQAKVPFFEPELEELLEAGVSSGRLRFTTDYATAIPVADVVMVTVGTPSSPEGKADLSYVLSACKAMGPHLQKNAVIVIKSTVPPGSFAQIAAVLSQETTQEYHLASVPEFLREGSAVADTKQPDRIVLGVTDEISRDRLVELHKPFQATIIITQPESAQLGKYASNAYLALRIGFINQMADFCEATGADIQDVISIIGYDKRIGSHYWYPGLGYGGSCFPKDVRELAYTSGSLGLGETLFTTLNELNAQRLERKMRGWEQLVGGWSEKKIAVLGLSFKPNTTDMREAPSLHVIPMLLTAGAQVFAYDPMALAEAKHLLKDKDSTGKKVHFTESLDEATASADVVIALVEWPHILSYNFPVVTKKTIFIDARNQFDPTILKERGYTYIGIGRK